MLGTHDPEWVRIERDQHATTAGRICPFSDFPQDSPVPTVDTVKRTDRGNRTPI